MTKVLTLIALALTSASAGQAARPTSNGDGPDKQIADQERQRAESVCTHDAVAKEIFATDFVGLEPSGSEYDKSAAEAKEKTLEARDCHLSGIKIRSYGDTLRVAYGTESATFSVRGQEHLSCLSWTHIWLQRDDKWQIVAAQDAALPCK